MLKKIPKLILNLFQVQYILHDGSILVQKEIKKDSNKNNYRRMIVVNQPDLAQTTTQVPVTQQRIITQQIPANGSIVEAKPSVTALTNANSNTQHRLTQQVITPMGPLTLTADEYNELMQRRMQKAQSEEVQRKAQQEAQERAQQEAVQRAQQEAQHRAVQQMQEHQNIAVQVQKIVQSLEEDIGDDGGGGKKEDEDIEMQMIVPKMETDSVHGEEVGTSSDNKAKTETAAANKNAERPFACDKCGKKFLLKHHLTTHQRVHSGKNKKRFL